MEKCEIATKAATDIFVALIERKLFVGQDDYENPPDIAVQNIMAAYHSIYSQVLHAIDTHSRKS